MTRESRSISDSSAVEEQIASWLIERRRRPGTFERAHVIGMHPLEYWRMARRLNANKTFKEMHVDTPAGRVRIVADPALLENEMLVVS